MKNSCPPPETAVNIAPLFPWSGHPVSSNSTRAAADGQIGFPVQPPFSLNHFANSGEARVGKATWNVLKFFASIKTGNSLIFGPLAKTVKEATGPAGDVATELNSLIVIACVELLNIVTLQLRVIAVTSSFQHVVGPMRALGLSLEDASIVIFSLLKELASFANHV